MLKVIKTSVRDTFIYSIGTFSSKLAGFILVPLYTNRNYLSSTDYGVLNLVEANIQFIISVFGVGLWYAYERWFYDKDYPNRQKSIFFTVLVTSVAIAIMLFIASLPFTGNLSELLFQSSDYAFIAQLMILNAGVEIIAQTPNSLIRLSGKPVLFTSANVLKLIISLTATVGMIVWGGFGLEAVYYGQLLGLFFYFLILSPFLYSWIEVVWEGKVLREMVFFRFPSVFPIIALNIFSFSDRYILSRLIGVDEAGVYSLGAKLANTIKVFVITAVWLALMPTMYKMMNDPGHKRFYSKVMTYLGFSVMIVVMVFSFFSKEIVSFFATEDYYLRAYQVMPFVALGIYFGLLKDVSMMGLNITKRTGSIATITIIISAINVGLNLLLIPYLGIVGSALAGMGAQLFFLVAIFQVAQKNYPIPYEVRKVLLMIFLFCVMIVIVRLIESFNFKLQVLIKISLISLFPILLYFFGFYETVELKSLKGFWLKWRNPKRWRDNIATLKF
jgi:O-antigen/teichoic acid export membrane protein